MRPKHDQSSRSAEMHKIMCLHSPRLFSESAKATKKYVHASRSIAPLSNPRPESQSTPTLHPLLSFTKVKAQAHQTLSTFTNCMSSLSLALPALSPKGLCPEMAAVQGKQKKKRNKIVVNDGPVSDDCIPCGLASGNGSFSYDEVPIAKAGPSEFQALLERELARERAAADAREVSVPDSVTRKTTFLKRGEVTLPIVHELPIKEQAVLLHGPRDMRPICAPRMRRLTFFSF